MNLKKTIKKPCPHVELEFLRFSKTPREASLVVPGA